ncbi:MAG: hypothetical protein GY822_19220 [Deltaproteobacteria bacterium]|nr:hypothetical protein [Deltaproteobacteria bacterium]
MTRAHTNSRRTQKESGKDILSGRDVKRIVDAAKEDGVTPDEVKLIVDQVGLALNDDKLELGTSTRQRNFNKLFDTLANYQNIPVETQGHASKSGDVNWINALTTPKDEGETEPDKVPTEISLVGGVAAYERVANLLATSRRRPAEGGPSVVNLDVALEKASPAQQEAVKAFYEDVTANGQPATRDNFFALLDSRIAGLQMADVDGNSVLSAAELKGLDKVGSLAADLAKALEAREPVAAAAAHVFGEATGAELGGIIRDVSAEHKELSYSYARTVLFSELHNTKDTSLASTPTASSTPQALPATSKCSI